MAINPWDPQAAVGPARSVGPAPVDVAAPFSNVNGRGGTFGGIAGTVASLAGMPFGGAIGAGIGTGFDVRNANDQLTNLGLDRSVAFGPSFANNMSFGIAGRSSRDQFQDAVRQAYPGLLQALTPAPPVAAPVDWSSTTPSQDFFSAINDMNNVGRLGDVFSEQDAARAAGGGVGESGGMSSADSHGAQEAAQGPGNEGGMYRVGGYVPHDGDRRLEPVKATLHEGEFVIRPEAVKKIGVDNLKKLNAMATLLREGR